MKTEGFAWGVDVGFHAIPSMKWVPGLAMVSTRDETD
jgi:hypothetical protein